MFEDIKKIEQEKRKNQEIYQENIKLSIKFKKLETKVKDFYKKLEEYKLIDIKENS